MMSYDQGAGVTPVEIFEQLSHGSLLFGSTRIGGLTADVEPALVADAYRVLVVSLAVGTDDLLAPAWLDLSVTTDDVVVANGLPPSRLVPGIYLRC